MSWKKEKQFRIGVLLGVIIALLFCVAVMGYGQNPQSQTAPLYAVNAKYTNGVAPGYWPTQLPVGSEPAATGLDINIGPGTVNCGSGAILAYAGGSFPLTANTTNYIYLNTSSSCAPQVKTTAFVGADIPIATVVTGSSTISSLTDDRTPFTVPPASGTAPINGIVDTTGGTFAATCGLTLDERASGATTVNLPAITQGCAGIIMRGPSAGAVTVAPPSGVSYDGVTTQLGPGDGIGWYTDGTGYHSTRPLIAGSNITFTSTLTGITVSATGGGGGSGTIPANAKFVFACTSGCDDDTAVLAPHVALTSYSQSGTVVSFVNTGTNGFTAGDWVSVRNVTGWNASLPSGLILGTGHTLFQILSSGLSSTAFQIDVGSITPQTSCSSSCGFVETAMNFNPFIMAKRLSFPTAALSNIYVLIPAPVYIEGMDSTYTTNYHPLSPAVTGVPAYLVVQDHTNEDANCIDPALVKAAYSSLFGKAHADGYTVVATTGTSYNFNQVTSACHDNYVKWNSNRKWLISQGKNQTTVAAGNQFWDYLVDTSTATMDGTDSDMPTWGKDGQVAIANAIAASIGSGGSPVYWNPFYWGAGISSVNYSTKWSNYSDDSFGLSVTNSAGNDAFTATPSGDVYASHTLHINFPGICPNFYTGCFGGPLYVGGDLRVTGPAASSGQACLHIDTAGNVTNTGADCVTGATSVPLCSDSSGSGTAQSCTTSPTFTPSAGSVIAYTTTTANTGTGLTINVNSLGAKSVAKWQGTTTLAANDMLAGKYVLMTYDGTNWEASTIGNAPTGGGGGAAPSVSLDVQTGAAASPAGLYRNAPSSGTVSHCYFTTTTSDGTTDLTFNVKLAGTNIISGTSATVTHGAAAKAVSTFSLTSGTISVTQGNQWEIDITAGTSSWTGVIQCY
jgi:hypothetical protein